MDTRWIISPQGLSPRLRGNPGHPRPSKVREGLSPRLRGNLVKSSRADAARGSIPAPAGEPSPVCWWGSPACGGTYPRACGGTGLSPRLRGNRKLELPTIGLSPRLRGNPMAPLWPGLSPRLRGNPLRRSIPAPAGEPSQLRSGLSPRRGKGWFARSIPAPAGEPFAHGRGGLSPRLRGKCPCHPYRSIPAPAGEPIASGGVYPRACGGNGPRSIPAPAGEPSRRSLCH